MFDPTLVEAVIAETPGSRDDLLDAWIPVVLGWCTRLGGPTVEPEDAAQDVMIIVLDKIGSLKSPEAFPSWVFGITRRVLASYRRQSWVKRWIPGLTPEGISNDAPEKALELSELSKKVQKLLLELPSAQREVLVLCDVEERTDEEVANILGIPVGTVKSRLRLARKKFKVKVEQSSIDLEGDN